MPTRRSCSDCGIDCFPKKSTLLPRCRNCLLLFNKSTSKFKNKEDYKRDWSLRKKYNISLDDFETLWIIFQGKCGICSNLLKLPEKKLGQSLDVVAVDHDHQTGKVRGLLCNACNKGLGLFRESISNLEKAKEYLDGRS